MRLVIVSNRAPVSIVKDNGGYRYENSSGGLATGLTAYVERIRKARIFEDIIWVGWPGGTVDEKEERTVSEELREKHGVKSVFLSEEVMNNFYEGFCNKTIWPLFHYFPSYVAYEKKYWDEYVSVNETFCEAVRSILKPGDVVWVHDYHLMLLPAMLRKKHPGTAIGFFLHIPFPSYEVFRLLPSDWRREIILGLMGADLVGFHTHDYCTYFLQSTLRILGTMHHLGELYQGGRLVKTDTFPMGIDYEKYRKGSIGPEAIEEKEKLRKHTGDIRIILSMDRQDYSKGILNRLRGYEHFLENNPHWKNRVTLIAVIVPSRIGVENYQAIKSQIDELVGSINGKYGSLEWMPIIYQYRSVSFPELMALYSGSDVALVTPLRDGMNLVAKEYIASRTDGKGVLILSEMAGASDELAESILINPNNIGEISTSLLRALEMGDMEQAKKISVMQERIRNYTVFHWADDFLRTLDGVKQKQSRMDARALSTEVQHKMVQRFKKAESRLLFLDYDGTLVPHMGNPMDAEPTKEVLVILQKLSEMRDTRVVLISGRDKSVLENWFGWMNIDLVAEHGVIFREKRNEWKMLKPVRRNWKKKFIPLLNSYAQKLPGSFLEEKEFSLVFHYRRSEPALAAFRVKELMSHLVTLTENMDVNVRKGSKIVEVRNAGIDKGVAALNWLSKVKKQPAFILAVGDDTTDEDLFRALPKRSFSIKVGLRPSYAMYNLHTTDEVISFLNEFVV